MSASLPAEESQKYFLSFKNGFCWSVCNTAVGYTVKFCSFKLFQSLLSESHFLSLHMQHLLIYVPKYVNPPYVHLCEHAEWVRKNKRSHSIFGKGTATPENQPGCSKGQVTFQSWNKAVAYTLVSDLLHTNLHVTGIIAHSSRIRTSYVYFKVAIVNVWQQMDSGPAPSLSCKFT